MASQDDPVYCTLLLSDHYLPGAMVLAHSLRDNGSKAKLVVLYTPDNLLPSTVNELRTIYDELIPVDSTLNGSPANLWLMDRPDLISAFTKIELWRQTQFRRIVYIDCDVVALRPPDELLSLDADFAAAPDVGWPDCFNSGVMVLRPNLQDYSALVALAQRGVSFDGADQGLLNEHFRDWHRLSFTYNCTPSANYQYIPAYKHFQSTISLIHFIGAEKPWNMPRQVDPVDSPYNQLLGSWWAVYDRHYRPAESEHGSPPNDLPRQTGAVASQRQQDYIPDISQPQEPWSEHRFDPHHEHPVQHISQHEYQPDREHHPGYPESQPQPAHASETWTKHPEPGYQAPEPTPSPIALSTEQVHTDPHEQTDMQAPALSAVPRYVRGEEHVSAYMQPSHIHPMPSVQEHHWEPEREHHPDDTNEFHTKYEQLPGPVPVNEEYRAPAPEKADVQTFEPPQAEWDASREPPPLNTKPEGINLQRETYFMSDDPQLFEPPPYPEAPKDMYYQLPETKPEPKKLTQLFPWESRAPKPTRVFLDGGQSLVSAHGKYSAPRREEPAPPAGYYGSRPEEAADTWENYSRSNAWDEVPEIQRYIQAIQGSRKARTQVISESKEESPAQTTPDQDASVKLTDFPSEVERPSLPVTPAPIERPSVWNRGSHEHERPESPADSQLPAAEGVPNQEDWNPLARLEELRRRQSEVLVNPDLLSFGWADAMGV